MRRQGKITFWKEDKGYGFITPSSGPKQVFVHISAFVDKSQRPQVNQLVTFTLSEDKKGRPRAIDVTRAGERVPEKISRNRKTSSRHSVLMTVLAIGVVGAFAYSRFQGTFAVTGVPPPPARLITDPDSALQFSCDGRKYCSQMTSCAEARYFVQHCGNTEMDGDGDGVPCERQWCYRH